MVAKNAIEAAMKIHGNLGYSAEFPLQQRYRDATAYLVADGTPRCRSGSSRAASSRGIGSARERQAVPILGAARVTTSSIDSL